VETLLDSGVEEEALIQLIQFVNLIAGYNRFNLVFSTDPDPVEDGGWLEIAEDINP